MLAQVVHMSADKDHFARLPRCGERLNCVVQGAFAEIATIAGVLSIPRQLHLVGFHLFDAHTDLSGDSVRISALRGGE